MKIFVIKFEKLFIVIFISVLKIAQEYGYVSGEKSFGQVVFIPQPIRAVGVLIPPMVSGWLVGLAERKVCLGCISETVRYRKLILGGDIGLVGAQHHCVTLI